jgi:hypothetical protein
MITAITVALFLASHILRGRVRRRRFAERLPGAHTKSQASNPASGRWAESGKLMSTEV